VAAVPLCKSQLREEFALAAIEVPDLLTAIAHGEMSTRLSDGVGELQGDDADGADIEAALTAAPCPQTLGCPSPHTKGTACW
jgi:hypothetical protein